jgi:L-ascorbate metabolism protein UlaG (beta-lactamase superfamily)
MPAINKEMPFYVPIGVDHILKSWGVPQNQIFPVDWYDSVATGNAIQLISLPAVHFSGRGFFDRNKTHWTSWIIKGKKKKLYFGGDSGYHGEYKKIGAKYGPFDMTCLEIGAYDKNWDKIHLGPELAVRAHMDLKGKVLLPIHWGTYDLAIHPWKDPVEKIIRSAEKKNITLCLPRPGQLVSENHFTMVSRWWET